MIGSISKLVADRAFAFVTAEGKDFFLHLSDCEPPSIFGALHLGLLVEFDVDVAPKGPRARNVRLYNAALTSQENANV